MLVLLLEYGARAQVANEYGDTPLHIACFRRNYEASEILLQSGADPNVQNSRKGETPLHVAVYSGSAEIVELLLRHGANMDIQNN